MPSLRSILVPAVALVLAAGAAFAGDPAELKARREAAMAAASSNGDGLGRAKAMADLAALDDVDSAKAFAECVAALAAHQAQLEKAYEETRKAYEPLSGFTFSDRADWDRKKKLIDQMERDEERLQETGLVVQAALTAVSKLRNEAALAAMEKLAFAEPDPRGRYVLVGGLASNPAAKGPDLFRKATKDESWLVRLAALDGLGNRKDPANLEVAVGALKDPSWPLRRAAVRALAAMHDVKAVPHLVAAMQTEDGMLLEEYEHALEALTGAKLGHFADAWRRWYEEHKAELSAQGAKAPPVKAGKAAPNPVNYYGIEAVSRKVLFVIDISGSMKEEIGGAEETTGVSRSQQLSGPKIEIAKRMLSDAIHKLEPATTFNIVFFNHQVRTFEDRLVPASPENVGKADLMIMECGPSGSTWAYGALQKAFEFAGVSGAPVTGKFDPLVDTIFFLSDGAPTDGDPESAKPMEPDVILKAVAEWNRVARLRIHTIAIDPRIGKGAFVRFMKSLAAQNSGTYTEVGAK
jgi:hypothetical protein